MRSFKKKFSFDYYFAWAIGGPVIGYDRLAKGHTIIFMIPFIVMEFSINR